jgi:predicted lipoprotein with Yx(FWY)xxD motif
MHTRRRWLGVLLVAFVALSLAACGDDDNSAESTTSSQPGASQAPSVTSPNTTAVVAADVNVATNKLGEILVDTDGLTLYVLTSDTSGVSTCVDSCAQAWPPLLATSVSVGSDLDAADFSLIARPDGTQQIAVKGRPLYTFAGDTAPGDTAGQALNNVWFVVSPAGEIIGQ